MHVIMSSPFYVLIYSSASSLSLHGILLKLIKLHGLVEEPKNSSHLGDSLLFFRFWFVRSWYYKKRKTTYAIWWGDSMTIICIMINLIMWLSYYHGWWVNPGFDPVNSLDSFFSIFWEKKVKNVFAMGVYYHYSNDEH